MKPRTRDFVDVVIVPKSERAQRYHSEVFLPRIKKIHLEIAQTQLSVLVWGPANEADPVYSKRVEIRNKLRELGLDAFFSEDEVAGSASSRDQTAASIKQLEYAQALAADLVVVLRSSFGSTAELHDFAEIHEIAGKLIVFLDRKTYKSYSSRGTVKELAALSSRVYSYNFPTDVQRCKLLHLTVEAVQAMQRAKYVAMRNVRIWGQGEDKADKELNGNAKDL